MSCNQLLLPFQTQGLLEYETFHGGPNVFVKDALSALQQEPFVFLSGPAGSGKTHLAEAYAKQALTQGEPTFFLSCTHPDIDTMLPQLDHPGLLILEDIHLLPPGQLSKETALFHCYNQHFSRPGTRLLLTSQIKAAHLALALPDLHSRLQSALSLHLQLMTDHQDLEAMLNLHAHRLALLLPADVAQFLLIHYARETKTLIQCLEKFAIASLKDQRRLTLPYVKQMLSSETD